MNRTRIDMLGKGRVLRNMAGISLIEMMVTLTILAVVALALADGLVSSMRVTSVNEEHAAALRTAREKLEWLVTNKRLIINSPPAAPQIGTVNPPVTYPYFVIDSTPANYGVIKSIVFNSNLADPINTNTQTFDVFYAQKDSAATVAVKLQSLLGGSTPNPFGSYHGEQTGEFVVMFDENRVNVPGPSAGLTAYGRDLTGGVVATGAPLGKPDGLSDGVRFAPIGDMDMDGIVGTGNGSTQTYDMRWLAFGTEVHGRLPVGVVIRWIGASGREERVELFTVISFFQQYYGDPIQDSPLVPQLIRYD